MNKSNTSVYNLLLNGLMLSQDSPNDFQVSAAPPKIGKYKTKLECKILWSKTGGHYMGESQAELEKRRGHISIRYMRAYMIG